MGILWATGLLLGNSILWFSLWGRLTALQLPKRLHDMVEGLMVASIVLFPVWLLGRLLWLGDLFAVSSEAARQAGLSPYDHFCLLVVAYAIPNWLWQRWRYPAHDRGIRGRTIHVARQPSARKLCRSHAAWAIWIPGNQILELEINEKRIHLPQLSPALEGLTIVHFSDFHFTGHVVRDYYEFVAEEASRLQGDLIAFTGDILDNPDCLDWFPEVFGRMQGRYGVFAILGNHDQRMGTVAETAAALEASGVQYLGGTCRQISVAGEQVLLAGNELPWLPAAEMEGKTEESDEAFRLLLTHSPDQFEWARRYHFDLALAGHTHGGQVRLPLVGPILAPSRFGTRYASGLFYEDPTWMHVSRGIGGKHPLRLGCRPELTRLILTSKP
jgi:uncharacterized protein